MNSIDDTENDNISITNNIVSCIYVPTIFWVLYLCNLDELNFFLEPYLQYFLAAVEFFSYFVSNRSTGNNNKHEVSKKSKVRPFFKGLFVWISVLVSFYIVTIIFGAPFFSRHQETALFALTMALLTLLPCILHLEHNKILSLMLSLTSLYVDQEYQATQFLRIIQSTCLGAWIGAIIIPLDWNKPYQVWPVPCIIGALLGYFIGNLFIVITYLLHNKSNRKLKSGC